MWTWASGWGSFPFSRWVFLLHHTDSTRPPQRAEVWPEPPSLRPISWKVRPPLTCPRVAGLVLMWGPFHLLEPEPGKSASKPPHRKEGSQASQGSVYEEGHPSLCHGVGGLRACAVVPRGPRASLPFYPQPVSSEEGAAGSELNFFLHVWQGTLWKLGCFSHS